jgi:hypothetical protein
MPAVPVAVRRAIRRTRVKEIRSGSRSAASAARVIRSLVAWWASNHAQISWWTSSGSLGRRILPGPRRWVLSWSLPVSCCRVAPAYCCAGAPSEPCLRR